MASLTGWVGETLRVIATARLDWIRIVSQAWKEMSEVWLDNKFAKKKVRKKVLREPEGPICRVVNYVSSEHLVNWLSFSRFIEKNWFRLKRHFRREFLGFI